MNRVIQKQFEEALALMDAGDLKGALAKLLPLTKVAPDEPVYWSTAGLAYWQLKRYGSAVKAFRKAIALKPAVEAFSLGLFHCLWQQGKKVEALDEVKRFMSVGHSADYMAIVREINDKDASIPKRRKVSVKRSKVLKEE